MEKLGKVQARQIALSLLAEMPPGKKWHICKFHDEQFPSAAALDEHFASAAHNNACDHWLFDCHEQFDTFQELGEHINKKRHGGYCAECKAIWSNTLYMEETHKAEQNKCHICGLTFHSAALLLVHLETNNVPVQYDECIVDIRVEGYQHPMLHPHIKADKIDRQAPLDIHDDSLTIEPGQRYFSATGLAYPQLGDHNMHDPKHNPDPPEKIPKRPRKPRPTKHQRQLATQAQADLISALVPCFVCNRMFSNNSDVLKHLSGGGCKSGVSKAQFEALLAWYIKENNMSLECPQTGCKAKPQDLPRWIEHLTKAAGHEEVVHLANEAVEWIKLQVQMTAKMEKGDGILKGVNLVASLKEEPLEDEV